ELRTVVVTAADAARARTCLTVSGLSCEIMSDHVEVGTGASVLLACRASSTAGNSRNTTMSNTRNRFMASPRGAAIRLLQQDHLPCLGEAPGRELVEVHARHHRSTTIVPAVPI